MSWCCVSQIVRRVVDTPFTETSVLIGMSVACHQRYCLWTTDESISIISSSHVSTHNIKVRVGDLRKASDSKLDLKAISPPSMHDHFQSHASKTHERAQAEQRLTCDMMRDGAGGGLNATLSDYRMFHSPVEKTLQYKAHNITIVPFILAGTR